MTNDNEMDKDDVFESLGELYRDGYVDMKPAVGSVDPEERQFSLTDEGEEHVYEMMAENDDMVLMLVGLVLESAQPFDSERDLAESLIEFAEWFAPNSGVNPLRVINRNIDEVPFIKEELPEELVGYYDGAGE